MIFIILIFLFYSATAWPKTEEVYGSFGMPKEQLCMVPKGKACFRLRRKSIALLAPNSKGELALTLECKKIGKSSNPLYFCLKDNDDNILQKGNVNPGGKIEIEYNKLPICVWRLSLNSKENLALVTVKSGRCSFELLPNESLRLMKFNKRLYFCVNQGRLKMMANGSTPNEHIEITIRDNDDKIVFNENSLNRNELKIPIDIPISAEQKGKIWSIQFSRVGWRKFEDMGLSIESGASPAVSLSPDQLIVPIFIKENKILDNGNYFWGVAISHIIKGKKGYSGTFSFMEKSWRTPPMQFKIDLDESWSATALCSDEKDKHIEIRKNVTKDTHQLIGIEYPQRMLLCGEANFIAYNEEKKPITNCRWDFVACKGREFVEVTQKEPIPRVEPTFEDFSRGFQLFQREEPGFIRLNSHPAKNEICHEIMGETSPGLVSCEFFSFLSLKTCTPHVSIGKLEGPVDIPKEAVKLLSVNMWPQQCGKRGTFYFAYMPELLLDEDFPEWEKNIAYQYCIRVKVPKNCPPGTYTAPVLFNEIPCATYKLIVDDFNLPEYDDITFGLYSNGSRWLTRNFTDDEILREMHNFREHGINALMHYPLLGSTISYDDGRFQVDLSKFKRIMSLYGQVGFHGIAVFSLEGLDSCLSTILGRTITMLSPEYEIGLITILNELRKMGEEEKWPEYCIHLIDEPTLSKGGKEAVAGLKIAKEAGFKTYNTCYRNVVRELLAPWLDYRCYNNTGFLSSPTKEANDILRNETLKDNKAFWWYGSGCYVREGSCQDCNIYSNRHMLGIFCWKSGTTGAWSWTFQNHFENPYNDFDGFRKDPCICYPAFEGNGTIDTLQWEAIREGIYDYRYIRFWDELCKQAMNRPNKQNFVSKSRRRINTIMESIKWNSLYFAVSNSQLRKFRKELIHDIRQLRN